MYCANRPLHKNRQYTNHRHHRSLSARFNNHLVSSSSTQCTHTKRRKRSLPENMAFFAPKVNHQFLAAPSLRSNRTNRFLNGDIDISSDLEISFASNVSLNSPPRNNLSLASECEPMDISPVPLKPAVDPTFESTRVKPARPRAFTSGARLFGADISNNGSGQPKNMMPNTSVNKPLDSARSKKIQRSALPTEWLAPSVHFPKVCLTFLCYGTTGLIEVSSSRNLRRR